LQAKRQIFYAYFLLPEMQTAMMYTDEELLTSIVQHDKQALEVMFRRYYNPLCRFAELFLNDPMQSEDVVQEMFINFWENRHKHNIIKVKSYLYRSVKNASLNQLDKTKRLAYASDKIPEDTHASYDSDNSLITAELKDKIQIAINSLPEQCRLIFQLSRQEEMSQKEIAEHLDISIKTVENQMGKALKILRERLQPYLNDKTIGIFVGSLFI
jgi:RNA polymerase sigma-70 factor (family 1)